MSHEQDRTLRLQASKIAAWKTDYDEFLRTLEAQNELARAMVETVREMADRALEMRGVSYTLETSGTC